MKRLGIAVLGAWDAVAPFRGLGVKDVAVSDPMEATAAWEALPKEELALVLVTEDVYLELKKRVADFPPREGMPAVTVIPGVVGGTGVGAGELREMVQRVAGYIKT